MIINEINKLSYDVPACRIAPEADSGICSHIVGHHISSVNDEKPPCLILKKVDSKLFNKWS